MKPDRKKSKKSSQCESIDTGISMSINLLV